MAEVSQIMTKDPVCCTADTDLQEVARLMVQHHCGSLPVVDGRETKHPVGIITDRDITCRSVAEGRNPLQMSARDCMSAPVVTVGPGDTVAECGRVMEQHLVRRLPVVDASGRCTGIVAQADIARNAPEFETAAVVRMVSAPTRVASFVVG